jgi:hypothetical protein
MNAGFARERTILGAALLLFLLFNFLVFNRRTGLAQRSARTRAPWARGVRDLVEGQLFSSVSGSRNETNPIFASKINRGDTGAGVSSDAGTLDAVGLPPIRGFVACQFSSSLRGRRTKRTQYSRAKSRGIGQARSHSGARVASHPSRRRSRDGRGDRHGPGRWAACPSRQHHLPPSARARPTGSRCRQAQ